MRGVDNMDATTSAHPGIRQQRWPDFVVVPRQQLCGGPLRPCLGLGHIDSALDRPPRLSLAHLDHLARLTGRQAQRCR